MCLLQAQGHAGMLGEHHDITIDSFIIRDHDLAVMVQASKAGRQSSVWLLDEIDAALDEINQRLVARLLHQLVTRSGGPSQIICISHNLAFQELCSSVLEVSTLSDHLILMI